MKHYRFLKTLLFIVLSFQVSGSITYSQDKEIIKIRAPQYRDHVRVFKYSTDKEYKSALKKVKKGRQEDSLKYEHAVFLKNNGEFKQACTSSNDLRLI